jgi:hypothetical protein
MSRDTSIPSFLIPQDGASLSFTISGTDAQLANQGYTYNQAGLTYNQLGVMYGGIYNTDEDIIPLLLAAKDQVPTMMMFSDIYKPYVPPPKAVPLGPGFFLYITQ